MKQVSIGVIGAGRIGRMHTENLVRQVPGIRVKSIADPALDVAWARDLGIEVTTQDPGVVLADPDIDAVAIFTSSTAHVALIEAAAAARKHIFCEKPIAFVPEELLRVGKVVRDAGVTLMVGLNRRFDPTFRKVRQVVADGHIGQPHIVRITNRDPKRPNLAFVKTSGGLFMDFSVHDFDTARFVTGANIVEVYAVGAALVDPAIAELGDVDTAIITVKLDSGALCVIDTSREAVYGYDQRLEVFGSKGSVNAGNVCPTSAVISTVDGVTGDKPLYSFVERYQQAYVEEMRAFARCVLEGTPAPVGIDDVRHAVVAAKAAGQSLAEGRPVRVG